MSYSAPLPGANAHLLWSGYRTTGFDAGVNPNLSATTYPTANLAIFVPIRVPAPCLVRKLFVGNGDTTSGNVDLGIYDRAGSRLVSTGSTAQSGSLQVIDCSDAWLDRGWYYLAVVLDNTTGKLSIDSDAVAVQVARGMLTQADAFPLPASATFARSGVAYLPSIGAVLQTVW